MKNVWKTLVRVCLFFAVFALLFSAAGKFFQPVLEDWNNYYTTRGFYEEPKDTIETLFMGASSVVTSVNPVQLYDDYGICSYNIATEQQPLLATSYWLEEVYRLHGKSLKNVVLDVSMLRSAPEDILYKRALDQMALTPIKIRALYDYHDGDLEDTIYGLLPLTAYHSRWDSLELKDYRKQNYDPLNGHRGYHFIISSTELLQGLENRLVIARELDESTEPAELLADNLPYFEKIVSFCRDKGLTLTLIKVPTFNWSDDLHLAARALADQYDLEYLDYNYGELYDELNLIVPIDSRSEDDRLDANHLSYYGAVKFTDSLGRYITGNLASTDVRGMEKYAFMDEQSAMFHAAIDPTVNLRAATTVAQYVRSAMDGNHAVFITVKGDAVGAMAQEDMDYLTGIGLTGLAGLNNGDSYSAVIDGGVVAHEKSKVNTQKDSKVLKHSGTLSNGVSFSLTSSGANMDTAVSCKINDKEHSTDERGLNIVVYNLTTKKVVGTAAFDTSVAADREVYTEKTAALVRSAENPAAFPQGSIMASTYAYLVRTGQVPELTAEQLAAPQSPEAPVAEAPTLFGVLDAYWDQPDTSLIIAVRDEASQGLSDAARAFLADYGLTKLSELAFRESYIGYVENGKVAYEQRAAGEEAITYTTGNIEVLSAGQPAGSASSIRIDGKEHSPDLRGLNIVVYDKAAGLVIKTFHFDTFANTIVPPTDD